MQWLFSIVDYFSLEQKAEKIKDLPWSKIFYLVCFAFMASSLVAALVGSFLLPNLEKKSPAEGVSSFAQVSSTNLTKNTLTDDEIQKIERRNLFNSEGQVADEQTDQIKSDLPKTELPIKIVGIIYGGTPFTGMATIENTQKNSTDSFLVGDYIVKEAKLLEVQRRRVIILHNGEKEYAELVESMIRRSTRTVNKSSSTLSGSNSAGGMQGKITSNKFSEPGFDREGTKIKISTDYKDQLLNQNLAQVLQDAKAEPHQVDGALKGFRMTKIRDNSIYAKAGLQNDDIVEEINGVPLNDIPGAIRLLNQLRNEKDIEVRVKRGDSSFTINLNVL